MRKEQQGMNASANSATETPADYTIASSTHSAPHGSERKLGIGDYVRLNGQQTPGRIESISPTGEARVLFGMLHTNVPLERLIPADAPKDDKTFKAATFVSKQTRAAIDEKKLRFKPEIDLRGMRADEALQAVALFMDDAILLEQAQVRILHGTGTGALRQLTRNYLRTLGGVRAYHDEHVQMGGSGITVVELE